ncbi:MFS general substrate transporter [Peniophora sp. CONT]|nr:MFS general substrate transporter [Peniophora sp. CONT]
MPASDLIKDTTFGHLLRAVCGAHILPHSDELDLQAALVRSTGRQPSPAPSTPAAELDAERRDIRHESDPDSGKSTAIGLANLAYEDSEKADATLVGWYGPDDPENPQSWSSGKKGWVLFQTCFSTFAIYIGSSIYTAGLSDVQETFHVSEVAATLGLSLFVAGFGLGPMLWAPLCEIPQIGRLPVYMATLPVFVLFMIPTALATNFGMLLAFRFLTGFIGSPVLANGGANIADIYHPQNRAYAVTAWGVFAFVGPVLGPLLGGFAAHAKGWTWTMWELMWLSGFTLVMIFLFFPETSADNILYRRARRLRKATGNEKLHALCEAEAAETSASERFTKAIVTSIALNFVEPIVLVINLYTGLIYALLYIWFESFPIVFIGIYGFREQFLGRAYLGILCGVLLVAPFFLAYLKYVLGPRRSASGDLRPEERLLIVFFVAPLVAICLFWFGWSSRESVHWLVPIIGSSLFGCSLILFFNAILNYLADAYPMYAASVLAGNDLVRSCFGATFPLFARALYTRLGVGWASTLLGLLACAFIPIPVLLYRYGESIRLSSRRARHEYH